MDSVTSSFQKIAISQTAGAEKLDSDDESYDTVNEYVGNGSIGVDHGDGDLADGAANSDSAHRRPTAEEQEAIIPFKRLEDVEEWDFYIKQLTGKVILGLLDVGISKRGLQMIINGRLENRNVIHGERLFQGKKKVHQTRLPHNYPDEKMYVIKYLHNSSDYLAVLYPVLIDPLIQSNYLEKFVRLIQLEEVQEQINLRKYDMFDVVLRRKEGFFWLKVKSLAEGRPSLLPGDVAAMTISGTNSVIFEGVIHYVELDGIKLRFHSQFENQYRGEAVDVFFKTSRTSIRRQHFAVERASQLPEEVLFPTSIIFKDPLDKATDLKWFNTTLNERQKLAVTGIVRAECRPSPFIVFGPPGTGKTVTIVEAILQIWKRLPDAKILACSGSNSCADMICHKLIASGAIGPRDVKRILAFSRGIPEGLEDYCTIAGDDEDGAWTSHRITVSTCSNVGRLFSIKGSLTFDHYTHVIIDEAATVTEPEALISVLQVAELSYGVTVLVGDPFQLGPVIHCRTAKKCGLELPLMSRLFDLEPYSHTYECTNGITEDPACIVAVKLKELYEHYGGYNPRCIVKLIESYRCCPELMAVNNKLFYRNELICHGKEDKNLIRRMGFCFPIVVIGVVGEEMQEKDNPSWLNCTEIVEVVKYYTKVTRRLPKEKIGIITPYKKQAERIRSFVREYFDEEICKTSTVQDFQGQERDVIILSLVRSQTENFGHDHKYNLGFLFNEKRFNVATSRAKKMLIVIGNPFVMAMDACWLELIKYAKDNDSYLGVEINLDKEEEYNLEEFEE